MSKAKTETGPIIGLGTAKAAFRAKSARAVYHERMGQFVGKPLADFVVSVAKSPPSVPTKGKLKGQQEPVQGWVSYLVRNEFYTIS